MLNIAYKRLNIYKQRWLGGLLMHFLLMIAGVYCFDANSEITRDDHFSKIKSRYLIATVSSEPKLTGQTLKFVAKVERSYQNKGLQTVSGHLMVSVKTDSTFNPHLKYGDRLLIPANYTAIAAPLNPAEFNYKSYMANQNIYQQAYLNGKQITVLESDKGNPIISFALGLRQYLVNKLKVNMRDTDAIAVASTIILGYRADLKADVREAYAKTGTMHLLSVAGMHVGLIYFFVSFFLSFLLRFKHGKLLKVVLSIVLIWCYALITGFSPAVCRAVLMLSMVIIGMSFSRHINKLNVLAVSAFILLLYNPFYIMDVGFQLSYIAVGGIIIIQPYIYRWLSFKNKIANEFWLVTSVSVAAQLVLFPLGAFYFHDFPVYFLVSNLFIVLPSAIVMYVGIIYMALPAIPLLSTCMAWVLEHTVIIMTKTLLYIEHAPFGSIEKIWLTYTELLLLYALLAAILIFLLTKNKVWFKTSFALMLIFIALTSVKQLARADENTVAFCSISKHPAIMFRNGNKSIVLTDLKTDDKSYQYAIQPMLDSCGITEVSNYDVNASISNAFLMKSGNLIQIGDNKILIINKRFGKRLFPQKLAVDYIYITGSPAINLQYLMENYNFRMAIAGNNNSSQLLKKLDDEASAKNIPFYNLKRNKAFITTSNIN
ncbi:ComEC family competence protein [Mucilaginibacter sp. HMF5004]|uniref:ComEC/Rec2 family competence protein n=1 Tax=Mucilaginibacter rivuli TaxID=2857527 RepID=UPI001C5FD94A|nr:ComEC/Rec2 family competence protein [Mucilaginibacter rivuli]MBW4889928.1 ComEC family competence protein [Mucilaginibacter rivuli]